MSLRPPALTAPEMPHVSERVFIYSCPLQRCTISLATRGSSLPSYSPGPPFYPERSLLPPAPHPLRESMLLPSLSSSLFSHFIFFPLSSILPLLSLLLFSFPSLSLSSPLPSLPFFFFSPHISLKTFLSVTLFAFPTLSSPEPLLCDGRDNPGRPEPR